MNAEKLNSQNFDEHLDNIINDNVSNTSNVSNVSEDNVQTKVNQMILNNGWNDKNEKIVISIGENAASYKWMHEKSSEFYSLINKILSIIMIVFSTGLTAGTILPDDNALVGISITRRIFTYIITVLSVIQNFLKFEKLSEQHLSTAVSFGKLYHDIQQQMCMYRKDRQMAKKYVSDILKQYDSLIVNGPRISGKIIKSFKDIFQNSDISIPDIADKIQKIEIIPEIPLQPLSQSPNQSQLPSQSSTKNINIDQTRYGRYGLNNLQQIHNISNIDGDITDEDLEKYKIRQKSLLKKSDFEYQRYKEHEKDTLDF